MSSIHFGVIGGGQLGKLLIERGFDDRAHIRVYSPELPLCHPDRYFEWVQGDLNDQKRLIEFGLGCDVLTYEIESVSVSALFELRDQHGVQVYPSPEVLSVIQNKSRQKDFLASIGDGVLVPDFISYKSIWEVKGNGKVLESDLHLYINKTQEGGYDGYGVKTVSKFSDCFPGSGMLEEKIDIEKELSVIVARDMEGGMMCFPVVEMVMSSDHKLKYSITPARISDQVASECCRVARLIAEKIGLVGILAVELFLESGGDESGGVVNRGRILVNELAPRPHNSGHQTIEYCGKSQYDILAMILKGSRIDCYDKLVDNCAQMRGLDKVCILQNVIGVDSFHNPKLRFPPGCDPEAVKLYDYRKEESRPGRKLGHVVKILDRTYLEAYLVMLDSTGGADSMCEIERPRVAVIMGSKSDYEVVEPCLEVLRSFGVHHTVKVVSAHRDSSAMLSFGESAFDLGFEVIVAAAGGAAHLPGMIASSTILPVIGIPVKSSNSIDGWDSLLSIAQMPGGVPVATMGLNGAKNAGLMAVRILATKDGGGELVDQLEEYQESLKSKVAGQNEELRLMRFDQS